MGLADDALTRSQILAISHFESIPDDQPGTPASRPRWIFTAPRSAVPNIFSVNAVVKRCGFFRAVIIIPRTMASGPPRNEKENARVDAHLTFGNRLTASVYAGEKFLHHTVAEPHRAVGEFVGYGRIDARVVALLSTDDFPRFLFFEDFCTDSIEPRRAKECVEITILEKIYLHEHPFALRGSFETVVAETGPVYLKNSFVAPLWIETSQIGRQSIVLPEEYGVQGGQTDKNAHSVIAGIEIGCTATGS
uniref:Uncharacterized protein n=1 Tax=Romanomermis culicivorax TaxID=13658 RepID=A0A915JI50_ROMCU